MAERKDSTEGKRDTDGYMPVTDTPSQQGTAGGSLANTIASEDEKKRANDHDASVTRVRKADTTEPGTGNLGKENR